ncbi:uncharacterized protein T551_00891 [Pneumocystis jirovecii RU7]|uniref:Protein BOI2 n=1 Tax=Pneumocystis jirovecii (strain RU7) TaxID=1408657 RepID=A0A0W4ZV06_PNEJ7|nr:uncharacterized protein T551_00891 [Pneumocystis jirovecii RU7]KTW32209.1 hypothetical protein T551_00891 [Pneumocystis jirovecii RU7]
MKSFENIVFALHDFDASNPEDLPLRRGEQILVLKKDEGYNDGWWEGNCALRGLHNMEGQKGLFPVIYTISYQELVKILSTQPFSIKNYGKTVKENDTVKNDVSNIDDLLSYIDHNEFKNMSLEDSSAGVLAWTPQDVAAWIESKGFGSFANKFIIHEITGDILIQMDYMHLKELGILSFGKRFEIEREIKLLRNSLSSEIENSRESKILPRSSSQSMAISKSFQLEKPEYAQSIRSIDQISLNRKSYEGSLSYKKNISSDQFHRSSLNGVPTDRFSAIVSRSSLEHSVPTLYENKTNYSYAPDRSTSLKSCSRSSEISVNNNNNNNKSAWKATNKLVRGYKKKPKSYAIVDYSPSNNKISDHKKSARLSKRINQDTLKACPYGDYKQTNTLSTLKEIHSLNTESSETFKVEKEFLKMSSKAPLKKPSKLSVNKKSLLKKYQKLPTGIKEGIRNISVQDAIKEADYYGWMRKKTDRYGQWKLRFFCLTGTRLSYFYSEDDVGEKGLIDINSHRVVSMNNRFFYRDGKFCFKIVPPAPGTAKGITFTSPKVHYFSADTLEDMKGWVRAFIKITIGRDESVPVLSSCKVPTISLKAAREKLSNDASIDPSLHSECLSKDFSTNVSHQERIISPTKSYINEKNILDDLSHVENSSFINDIKSAWENVEILDNSIDEN